MIDCWVMGSAWSSDWATGAKRLVLGKTYSKKQSNRHSISVGRSNTVFNAVGRNRNSSVLNLWKRINQNKSSLTVNSTQCHVASEGCAMPYPEHGISKTGDYTLANIYNLLYSQIYYRKTKKKRNKTSYIFLLCTYLSECQQASAQSNIRHSFSFRDDNKNDNNQTNTHIWWDTRQVKPGDRKSVV